MPGLDAFFDGRWVSVGVKDVAGLSELGSDLPSSATDAGKAVAELETSASNLLAGAEITRHPPTRSKAPADQVASRTLSRTVPSNRRTSAGPPGG